MAAGPPAPRAPGPMVSLIDFSFEPAQAPDASFSFSDPGFGVFYGRQGFASRLVRGTSSQPNGTDLVLVEGQIHAWGAFRPFTSEDRETVDFFFPVGLYGDFRQVRREGGEAEGTIFEVTVMAASAGLGLTAPVGGSDIAFRAAPFLGIASRAFGTDTGSSAGFTADLEWASPEVFGRFGLFAGWSFRWQRWLLSAAATFADPDSRNVEYRGEVHAFQVGLTF